MLTNARISAGSTVVIKRRSRVHDSTHVTDDPRKKAPLNVHALLTFMKPYQRIRMSGKPGIRIDANTCVNKPFIAVRVEPALVVGFAEMFGGISGANRVPFC